MNNANWISMALCVMMGVLAVRSLPVNPDDANWNNADHGSPIEVAAQKQVSYPNQDKSSLDEGEYSEIEETSDAPVRMNVSEHNEERSTAKDAATREEEQEPSSLPDLELLIEENNKRVVTEEGSAFSSESGSNSEYSFMVDGTAGGNRESLKGRDVLGSKLAVPDSEQSTESELGFTVLKWGLIGLLISVPLILLPVLFLFARGGAQSSATNSAENKEEGVPVGVLVSITKRTQLRSTAPRRDPYLADERNHKLGPIQEQNEQYEYPCYELSPTNAVLISQTGQLFHPHSGLLFNPEANYLFNGTRLVDTRNAKLIIESKPNLVYDTDTKYVYERCLALAFLDHQPDNEEKADKAESSNHWILPMVASMPKGDRVRRATVDELPSSLAEEYSKLLKKNQLPTDQVDESAPPVKPQNPLLRTKRDFTKLNFADTQQTPRTSKLETATEVPPGEPIEVA